MKSTFKTIRPDHWQRAKQLRRPLTATERVLWEAVRSNKLGFTFRRQHPIGQFIVDFCCINARLVIEVDGESHDDPDAQMYDFQRTGYLESVGYRVLRFSNADVKTRLDAVLNEIEVVLRSSASSNLCTK